MPKIPLYKMADTRGGQRRRVRRIAWTLVDAGDHQKFSGVRWYSIGARAGRYVSVAGKRRAIWLSREVLGLPRFRWLPKLADHINSKPLDNRRANLRVATKQQNAQNRRKLAQPRRVAGGWLASVSVRGRCRFCKIYRREAEARTGLRQARAQLLPFSREARVIEPDPSFVIAHEPKATNNSRTRRYVGSRPIDPVAWAAMKKQFGLGSRPSPWMKLREQVMKST
jgi:hypothetical protein